MVLQISRPNIWPNETVTSVSLVPVTLMDEFLSRAGGNGGGEKPQEKETITLSARIRLSRGLLATIDSAVASDSCRPRLAKEETAALFSRQRHLCFPALLQFIDFASCSIYNHILLILITILVVFFTQSVLFLYPQMRDKRSP